MKDTFLVTVVVKPGPQGLQLAGAHREAEQEARRMALRYSEMPAMAQNSRPEDPVPRNAALVSHSVFTAPNGQVILTEIYERVA